MYPEGGYFYHIGERIGVIVSLGGASLSEKSAVLTVHTEDYTGVRLDTVTADCTLSAGFGETEIQLPLHRLGYYKATVTAECAGETVQNSTGIGVTTPHDRPDWQDSVFGVSANEWFRFPQSLSALAKMGVRYIRPTGRRVDEPYRALLRKYGLMTTVQAQGRHIMANDRYAPGKWNSAWHYLREMADVIAITEHGNEHWEERNLTLMAEWVKVSGLARWQANPETWFTNSGAAGVDIHKLQVLYDQGMFDYITAVSLHAYTFPMAPEQEKGFWSSRILKDFAKWMDERGIDMPVCCMEQGYPAMNGQTRCESYSPGDLVSLDGQADYLVRQWLVFISLGVSKFVWYNAPFADGFSLWEKDGPAPWPAAMALTQLIRFADHADYVGNYEADPGVWFVVFRNRENDRLQAAVWKPVYLARSCEKEKNLTADGQYTEASGLAQVNFTYLTPYIADDYQVVDIMGNPEETKEGAITIGERPVYVYGLTEDILPKLSDNRVFKTAKPRARPAPSPVILGFSDKNPVKKGEFITSVFRPGETREYELRIHNFGEETLEDTVILESDGGFEFSVPSTPGNGISGFTLKIPIAAPPGLTAKIPVKVTCPVLSEKNECKNSARLSSGKAHPVYQLVGITWPVSVVSVYKPLVAGDCLTLLLQNASPEPRTFEISVSHEHISFEVSRQTATVPAGEKAEITFMIKSVLLPFDPLLTVKISSGNITALYRPEIPVAYINEFPEVTERDLANAQKRLISHPDSIQMASDSYDGPSLIGNAKPVPLLSYGQFLLDEIHLHARFEVFDDTVVCVKNTRRNNADCDGVWLAVYASPEEKKANRFFAAVPANAAGNPEGAYLNEIRDGILFAKPFTDYDFSKISLRSEIFPDKYILTFAIDRQSVGIPPGAQSVTLYVRVLDMNHDDWTRMYDTGKTVYHIAQTT